jgi:RsiW-degrading membrane proteinase PrsW (M82 family)
MIKSLLFISIAPILIVALYIYLRDKYEKEPLPLLIKALFSGVLIVFPAAFIEGRLGSLKPFEPDGLAVAFYSGFIIASLTEEGLKYLVFMLFFWRNRNFNEKFDGIVYAVFISLGFAMVENIIYVSRGGYSVGMLRAITAVPAHALFGTVMGYHLAHARFYPARRVKQLILAFVMPFLWHGLYDFLLMSKRELLLLVFIPVLVFFWVNGFIKINELSQASVFRNDLPGHGDNRDEKAGS